MQTTTTQPVTRTYTTTQAPTTTIRTSQAAPVRTSGVTRTYTTAPTTTATRTYTSQPVRTSGVTRTYTTAPTTTVRTTGSVAAHNERRLDENSARILARKVFSKYDANGSGYMNSMETGQMISDLYSSLNVNHPANRDEGLEFMVANDSNSDNSMSIQDFEDIFVQHLSTGNSAGGFKLFLDADTYATRNNTTGRVRASTGPTTTYHRSPQRVTAPTVVRRV
jgi:hypothetical protein